MISTTVIYRVGYTAFLLLVITRGAVTETSSPLGKIHCNEYAYNDDEGRQPEGAGWQGVLLLGSVVKH